MEIVSMIASKSIDYTIKPVGQWLCYSFHYTSNIRSMKEQVEELRLASERLQHSIGAAIRNCLEIEGDVKKWLEDAAVIIELARQVVEGEKEEAKKKCCNGACLNLKLKIRHQLSRKAKKIVQDIGELLLKKPSSERVGFLPAPQRNVTAGSMDYVASKSRMLTVTRLMEALEDDKIHLIGLWGMAGVGKSTLVREIANQAMKKKLFDEVAIANVTQSPDPRRIQGEIADTLHLKFDTEETILGRASRLWERLTKKTDKKIILVILDDIWKNLDLKEIGIPYEGCKVLLTSRDRDLLVSGMGTQKDFGLEVLAKEEAWSFFEKMAGDCVKDPNLQRIAKEVAKACAGLPLALVTVSKALKNKELFEWNDALQLLRRPALDNLKEMQSTIYSSIELSYKHLENKVVQEVFLLCAQLASYIDERYVLRYCYSLGLFQGINTMEEARNKVSTIIRTLKDSCLLLPSPYSSKFIRMHDLVRDAAIIIASRDKNMFVMRTDGGLKEWPNEDALKRCKAFSVLGGDIHDLPNQMECPELRFLLVYGGDHPLPISNTFFIGMEQLKVLDFTKMQFSSPPSSLCLLINSLQTLCLDRCVLGDITVIGELKNLAILSLNHSEISQLPREIGLLSRLRLLDLSNCSKLEVIPPNILSRLVKLEELYMGNSFIQWEAEGLNNGRNNASLAELEHLLHLIALEIQIPNVNSLPKDLSFEKLERYIISVGDESEWSYGRGESSRTLKLKLNTSFQSQTRIKMILNKTENLYLDELKGVKSVLHELDWEGFRQLKHLHIQNNYEIKHIMNLMMSVVAFPALETFHLKKMMSLEEICHGQLSSLTSFGKLRVLKVEHCDKLKFVFSSSIAGGLSQLEELEIRECNNMGAIVMKEKGEIEEERALNLFPQLRRLVLKHLPKLMSFLSTQTSHVTDAREITSEGKPDFHMPILHEQVVFPNLESLELSSLGLEDIQNNQCQASRSSSILRNIQPTSRFQNLLDLQVKGSNKIKYLLSFSSARSMVQLKYLRILKCEVMKEILVTENFGVVKEIIPEVLFPRLESLILQELPLLKRFCEGSNIKFPHLKELEIDNCTNLKTFISKFVSLGITTSKELMERNAEESPHTAIQPLFNEMVDFPSLKYLKISHINELKFIWRNQFVVDSFHKLQGIIVDNCENLMNVFQSDMLARFQSLETLLVSECASLQEVFELQGLNATETCAATAIQLKKLYLAHLPKMKHVWNKDPQEIFSFQNLKDVCAMKCESLKSVFPASVARYLMQLEDLRIVDCGVEEIVAGEEGAEAITRFIFPKVAHLSLDRLPRLKCFYPRRHTPEWPILKDMVVGGCHEVEILASQLPSEALQESQLEISVKQSLFLVDEVVFPNLKSLKLSSIGLEDAQHNQHGATKSLRLLENMSRFQNLLELEVQGSNNIKHLLSYSTARCLVQLKYLRILKCEVMEEILVTEVAEETISKVLFPLLDSLLLKELPILKRLCEGSNIKFPSLKELVIDHCPNFKTFISKPAILGTTTWCKELKEMNAGESPHTAMQPLFNEEVDFPSLERLAICHMDDLKIIWGNQFAVDSFYKLKVIKVDFCENLVNIFQSSMLARFQSLEQLIIKDCGSLQEVFELQGINAKETHVATSKDPKPIFSFQNLQRVRVVTCRSLKSLFPASVATCLTQLEQIVIFGCEVLEEIVAREEAEQPIASIVFPRVNVVHLVDLPRLKWFYPGVHSSEWPKLKDMLVAWCPKVEIFASQLSSFQDIHGESQDEIPIEQPLFLVDDEVPFPSLENLKIICMADLKIIWYNQFTADSFCNPQTMKVEFCENLIDYQETCGVTATQLKELHLLHLPNLKHIWSKDPQDIFTFAMACESMESPSPGAEEDFPVITTVQFDDHGVSKIVLMHQNSSIFPEERILQIAHC